jgi:hypothetical protein
MSLLTDFYRQAGVDTQGRTLAEIWAYSDDDFEDIHDFIQWLFPLTEPSRFNPDAPLLTTADIAAFRAEPLLAANLRRSFERFVGFLGLQYAEGHVVRGADFDRKSAVFRHPNHNWLRITRVLTSTRVLGLEDASRAFFDFLKAERDGGRSRVSDETFRFWEAAARFEPESPR